MNRPAHDSDLPALADLLITGGDERITPDAQSGLNRYGYPPKPERNIPAFGSSTASAISEAGFGGADLLHARFQSARTEEETMSLYNTQLENMRGELRNFAAFPDTEIIFSDSGTTAHLLAAQLVAGAIAPVKLSVLMMSPSETGRGVPAALEGKHFGQYTPSGVSVTAGQVIDDGCGLPGFTILLRDADGQSRPLSAIDTDVETLVTEKIQASQRVLLNTVDCSKTGLVAPGTRCVMTLKQRYADNLYVLVDACQYRLDPATIRAYLGQGYIVALTGSKFMCGPSFSGALLIPGSLSAKMAGLTLSPALGHYAARAEWPAGWAMREILPAAVNYGLLLRWEAALVEMRSFHSLPEKNVFSFFESFAAAIRKKLEKHSNLELIDVPAIDRGGLDAPLSWDSLQTIFPVLLRGADGHYLNRDETKQVYDLAGRGSSHNSKRCRVGQPVECGIRGHQPVSALRLCLSAQHAVDALSGNGRGVEAVINEALSVLDLIATLAGNFNGQPNERTNQK